ncbi:mitochondrial carrier [Trichoderma citrinoviride]|uniref:Mitochondrial carrier n=1 Tax=Trichoderma citrinoviride TaxID=58853 RepID=A0A2T4AXJ9_9HYPO|nr:mitochondrial carrier [Trichoderma citrinoviride]PTB61802.1 mitochondrial carrier [Trichoderma citrinoviride]
MASPPPSPSFQSALLAGALAGTTVDLSLFPLDTLKTRLQSSAGFFPSGGFSGIYRGIGSALVGSAPGAAFFFCTSSQRMGPRGYPDAHARLLARRNRSLLRPRAHRGRQAARPGRPPRGLLRPRARPHSEFRIGIGPGGLPAVWRELYRGWGITVFREVPFTVIQFPLWEAMKAWGRRRRGGGGDVSAGESALYGSLAGGVAAAATTPLDVLKTRVMLSKERVSVADVFRRMAREEGVRPFFAGIAPRVTWISIGGAIFLGSYQWVINTMNSMHVNS